MDSWCVLTNVGYVAELVGLGVAAVGIRRIWKANTRRGHNAYAGNAAVIARPGATVEERLTSIEADYRQLKEAVDSLPGRIAGAQQDTERRWSEQVIKEQGLAIAGLVLIGLGLVFQWIGSFGSC